MKTLLRSIEVIIIVGMFAAAWYAYPWLPDQIPSHWGTSGEVDDTMSKQIGIWLLPLVTLVLALLLPLMRYIDPKKQNYKKFEIPFILFQLTMVAYFAYVFGIQLFASLYPESSGAAASYIIGGMGALFIIIGALLPKIRWNFFVGIRTPWTIASEKVWNRTHEVSGVLWMIAGALIVLITLVGTFDPIYALIPAIVLVALVPVVYSYYVFRQKR